MPHRIKKHSHVCNTAVLCGAHGAVCMCVFAYVVLCRWLIMLLASLACPTPLDVFLHARTPLELLPFLACRARSCACALAMVGNSSWRIVAVMPAKVFYIAPVVVFRTATPPHQTERRSWPQVVRSLETEIDESETFVRIQNALIRLLDEDAVDAPLMRKGFKKQKNAKLPRCVLVWARLVKKLLLLIRNDRNGRFCSSRISAIGGSA